MCFLKEERDTLFITPIINSINKTTLDSIHEREKLINLYELNKLDFLDDIDDILDKQFEIYEEQILDDIKVKIEEAIDGLSECMDNSYNCSMETSIAHQLDKIEELQKALFENITDYCEFNDILEYISVQGKMFRDGLINYRYCIYRDLFKNNIKLISDLGKSQVYNLSKDLLIFK